MNRAFAVLGSAVALAASVLVGDLDVATANGANSANARSAVVVQISGRLDATTDPVTDPRCAEQLYTLSGTRENGHGAVYTGTFDGVGDFCNKVSDPLVEPDPLGVDYHEEHTFVGTVHGCGTGTFKYSLDGVGHPYDPDKRYIPADEYWSIVEGTGTGDLAGIRSGLNYRTGGVTTDGIAFAVYDPATNSVTCLPPHPHSAAVQSGGADPHPARVQASSGPALAATR